MERGSQRPGPSGVDRCGELLAIRGDIGQASRGNCVCGFRGFEAAVTDLQCGIGQASENVTRQEFNRIAPKSASIQVFWWFGGFLRVIPVLRELAILSFVTTAKADQLEQPCFSEPTIEQEDGAS